MLLKERFRQRNEKGQLETIGYLVATVPTYFGYRNNYDNWFISIGISLCHPQDKFDKDLGMNIAVRRAETPDKEYTMLDKQCDCNCAGYTWEHDILLSDLYTKFVRRVLRYYKDKTIILPRIRFVK